MAGVGAAVGGVFALGVERVGPGLVVALVALVVVGVLALNPWWALGAMVAADVLFEQDVKSLFPAGADVHSALPVVVFSAVDLLVLTFVAAVVLDVWRSGRGWRLPGLMTWPLLVLTVATGWGLVVGITGGADQTDMLNNLRSIAWLVAVVFATVNLPVTPRALGGMLAGGVLLGAVKGLEGIASFALGAGPAVKGGTLTFLDPTPNWLTLLVVLGVLTIVVMAERLPFFLVCAGVLALASFVLSFRRNFWIGAVVAAVIVLVLVRGGRRARLLPLVMIVAALVLIATTGIVGDVQGPVEERVSTLTFQHVQSSADDRYRLDEARNVLAEIERHPLTGLGMGVPWTGRYPLSQEHPGGRFYTHIAALWFWLKLGILGLIAYLGLMATAFVEARRLGRFGATPAVRAGGIAIAAGIVALVLAETTGTFTGVSQRFDILLALVLGWVAAARAVPPSEAVPSRHLALAASTR